MKQPTLNSRKTGFTDLRGKIFGNLTVLKRAPNNGKRLGTYYVCSCTCGNVITVYSGELNDKRHPKQSCGGALGKHRENEANNTTA